MPAKRRQLPQVDRVVTKRRFLSGSEHSVLLGWAEEQLAGGQLRTNNHGEHRYCKSYEQSDCMVPAIFWDVRSRAVSSFSVTEYEDEPLFKCFLGCNTEGGFVHRHVDPSPPGKHHIRMNIMLSKPLSGGEPVIDGRKIQIEERDLWCFYPSFMPHESLPVRGSRKRFVISIGILVPKDAVG
jgi:hypothetical protein